LEQEAFNLLEVVAEVPNRGFGHVIHDSITSHFLAIRGVFCSP
jgi:hypothetical protein